MTLTGGARRELAAGHEAGHAVAAYHYGAPVHRVAVHGDLTPDGRRSWGSAWIGETPITAMEMADPSDPSSRRLAAARARADRVVLIAGWAANVYLQDIDPDQAWRSAGADLADLRDAGVTQHELERAGAAARGVLLGRGKQWGRLYARLLETGELAGEDVTAVLRRRK